VRAPTGYRFKSRLTFAQIRARLNELGHGTWEERDSGIYGDYIRGELWGVRMRIFDGQGAVSDLGSYDPKGFLLLDYARHPETIEAAFDARLRDELLPALEATEIHADERND